MEDIQVEIKEEVLDLPPDFEAPVEACIKKEESKKETNVMSVDSDKEDTFVRCICRKQVNLKTVKGKRRSPYSFAPLKCKTCVEREKKAAIAQIQAIKSNKDEDDTYPDIPNGKDIALYECNQCSTAFSTVFSFIVHKSVVHKQGCEFECKKCLEKMTTVKQFNEHMKSHYKRKKRRGAQILNNNTNQQNKTRSQSSDDCTTSVKMERE